MIIGEGINSFRQRLRLLEDAIAGLNWHESAGMPEVMLGEVRKLSATLGQLLVEAIAQGLIRAPAGLDIDHPWLAIARDRLRGKIVSASCRGYGVLVSPCSCREALQALAGIQRDYEKRLGIEAAHHIDAGSEILHRHVLYEALSWLPRVETPISFPKDIELEDADGTRIQMIADWVWEDLAVVVHFDNQRQEVVHMVDQASSPSKLLQQVEERKVVLAGAVRAIRESLEADVMRPTVPEKNATLAMVDIVERASEAEEPLVHLQRASEVILRESEDGKELQRVTGAGTVIATIPVCDLGEGRSTWRKLHSAAVKLQRDQKDQVNRSEALGCDLAGVEAVEGAEHRIAEHGRRYGYQPMIKLDREASKRFRDEVWAKLVPESCLQPSQLMPQDLGTKLRKPIFRIAVLNSDIPNLARHAVSAQGPRRRRGSAREDAARRDRAAIDAWWG